MANYQLNWHVVPPVTSITLNPTSTQIDRNQPFSYTGSITASYANGTTGYINSSDCVFTGYDMSAAGTYTVSVVYHQVETDITVSSSYSLTVLPIWEAIVNRNIDSNKASCGWDSNKQAVSSGLALENATAVTFTGVKQVRVTWQANAFEPQVSETASGVSWNYPCPYASYWHIGKEIKYCREKDVYNDTWPMTSWYTNWLNNHQFTEGAWNSPNITTAKNVDIFTINFNETGDDGYVPIFGNMMFEGMIINNDSYRRGCQSNGVSLVYKNGHFYLLATQVSLSTVYPLGISTVYWNEGGTGYTYAGNTGMSIYKIEVYY